jgi:hypothetical protein
MWDNIESDLKEMILEVLDQNITHVSNRWKVLLRRLVKPATSQIAVS